MKTGVIQKESRTPLYLQLAELIRRGMMSAALEPGAPLPTERELCERHEVSRATVREALNLLKQEGFVQTRRGAGNFAALPAKVDRDLLRIHDFNHQIEQSGHTNRAKVLEYEVSVSSDEVAQQLQLGAASEIIRVKRLRLAGDTPLFIETLYLPRERFSREDEGSLASTDLVLGRFPKEYGVHIAEVLLELEPVLLTEEQAKLLAVDVLPAAGLLNKRTSFDTNHVPALYAEWLFAGTNCRHVLKLTTSTRGGE